MPKYNLTLLEKETIILWNEEEDTVEISTYNQKIINRLYKAKEKAPEPYYIEPPNQHGLVYAVLPKNLLRISFTVPMSEDMKKAVADKMRDMRAKVNQLSADEASDEDTETC